MAKRQIQYMDLSFSMKMKSLCPESRGQCYVNSEINAQCMFIVDLIGTVMKISCW